MSSRSLDDLSPEFQPLAMAFLARLVEAGIPVMILNTRRSAEEQAAHLAAGVSWIKHSKHLTGDAIDIAPYATFDLLGPDKLQWDAGNPIWAKIGAIGESVGLIWGGRWRQRDLGHFERAV